MKRIFRRNQVIITTLAIMIAAAARVSCSHGRLPAARVNKKRSLIISDKAPV